MKRGCSRHRMCINYLRVWTYRLRSPISTRTSESKTASDLCTNSNSKSQPTIFLEDLQFLLELAQSKKNMGCVSSSTAVTTQPIGSVSKPIVSDKQVEKTRTERKYQRINGRFQSNDSKIHENVVIVEGESVSLVAEARIQEILRGHFFFSGMSNSERTEIIHKMIFCTAEEGEYIFKQSDLASAFFIIADGTVQVEINGDRKKTLRKDDYFGELALIYGAPRSAAIKAVQKSSFWCITRNVFRQTVQQYVKKNYSLAKVYTNKLPLFSFLTEKQKDSISYNMINLKYEDEQVIFKADDDANSFFMITQGKVEISIPAKPKLILSVGDSFGQQSFVENQVRIGTACSKGKTHCLSIGRDVVKNILGDRISNITNYNITKWALKRSKVLSKLSNIELEKLLETSEIKDFEDGEKVYKVGEKAKYLVVCLEGMIGDKPQGILIGEQMLSFIGEEKIDKDYLKKGRGLVSLINFESISKCTNRKLDELAGVAPIGYEKQMEMGTRKTLDYSHIQLQKLIHVRKLGEGQFGKVFLVKESKYSDQKYAIKCIKKQEIIENKMEKIILQQKHILEVINFPLMLSFMRSFKDNQHIYFLTEYIKGSELFDVIRQIGILSKAIGRFYISSLILSVEYLHLKNIVYRDLKPENVMVEQDGYLKLIDMGTAKLLTQDKGFRTFTIIGTPHYMAPQVMQGKGYSFSVDLWSLGILFYQFMCGQLPFADFADDPYEIHSIIMKETLIYPSFFTDQKAQKLIEQLLSKTPETRMLKGFPALKANEYFDGLDWEDLYSKKLRAPYIPRKPKGSSKVQKEGGRFVSHIGMDKQGRISCKQSPIRNWDEQF